MCDAWATEAYLGPATHKNTLHVEAGYADMSSSLAHTPCIYEAFHNVSHAKAVIISQRLCGLGRWREYAKSVYE